MKSSNTLAIAAIMFALSAAGSWAQETGPGSGMGPWMMGPNGMMNVQTGGSWMMGQGGAMPMMGWGGQGSAICDAMTSHVEGRLAFVKTELKVTASQATLWNAYADAVRLNAQSMQTHCTAMMGQPGAAALPLPDRLDQHEQFMASQLDALRAMNKTMKPLYAALDATQKKTADQFFWGPMGMM